MRVLITSDIHINQFSSYNTSDDPLFRLHQFEKLAQRLLSMVHEHGVGAVMIAGDFLHVASPRPFVVNAAGRFLKILSSSVPVFVTHGQHDYDSRTHMSRENSLLSLYDNIEGVQYLHKSSVTLDGTSFYFQGWTPEQDFSGVQQGQFDVLIGHATVNGAIMNNYGTTANGPEFANDKFKLCFMGDIHKPQTIKNIVIPGPPIQANFGDDADNSVIILDTQDLSWKRYSTHSDPAVRFLRFFTGNTTGSNDDPFTIVRTGHKKKASPVQTVARSVDIVETIQQLAESNGLQDTHKLCMEVTSKLEEDDLDLNYTINRVTINNFRSIKTLEWTPLTGITLIIGKIGTGKSTLVQSIRFALLGHRTPKSLVSFGENSMSVSIDLTYGGVNYLITRGFNKKSGYVKYRVGETEVESENQTECNNRIRSDLKFLALYETLHRDQQNVYFLENHSYADRVALVSRIIRLNITSRLKSSAEGLREPVFVELQSQLQKQAAAQAFVDNFERMGFEQDSTDYELLAKKTTEVLSQTGMLLDLERRLSSEQAEQSKLMFARSQLQQPPGVEGLPELSLQKASLQGDVQSLNQSRQKIKSLEEVRSQQMLDISRKQAQVLSLQSQIKKCEQESDKTAAHTCYACNQAIDQHLVQSLKQKLLQDKIDLQQQHTVVQDKIILAEADLEKTNTSIGHSQTIVQELEQTVARKKSEIFHRDQLEKNVQRSTQINSSISSVQDRIHSLETKIALFRNTINSRFNISLSDERAAESLSQNLRDNLLLYREKGSAQTKMQQLLLESEKQQQTVKDLADRISTLRSSLDQFDRYIELVGPRGQVVTSVLTRVSENMSNESIRVVAFKKLSNDETRPDFNVFLKVAGRWINYDELSGGQKSICDLFVLNHLVEMAGGAGSLVLDESFSQVGFEDLEPAVDVLKAMPVKHIFVVSHHENFPAYDNLITTDFDAAGVTTYSIPNGE